MKESLPSYKLTRSDVQIATRELVGTTLEICEDALEAARQQGVKSIDHVILSGGMTFTPFIRKEVEKFFSNSTLIFPNNPSVLVAEGAAIYAGMMMGRVQGARVGERRSPFSYGISCYRDYPKDKRLYMSAIIEHDEMLFDENGKAQRFPGGNYVTIGDNQTTIGGRILQAYISKGEKYKLEEECTPLGTYNVKILPYPRGLNGLNVTLGIDHNGILQMEYYEIKNPLNNGTMRFNMLLHADALTAPAG